MTIAGPLLAEDQDRPYEYRRFAVGDSVRIHLSAECRTSFHDTRTHEPMEHQLCEDGQIGTVTEVAPDTEGHSYYVTFDCSILTDGVWYDGGDFASSELELLDTEATR